MNLERSKQLIDLLNARLVRFDNTRNIQWKINAILWSGIVIVIGFLLLSDEISISCWAVIIVALVTCVIHGFTIYSIQNSLNWDKEIVTQYHKIINEDIQAPKELADLINEAEQKKGGMGFSWFILQMATTIGISTGGVLLLCDFCNCVCHSSCGSK